MKSAKEWQEQLKGETSVESIKWIQADALLHAHKLLRDLPLRHAAIELRELAFELVSKSPK